MCTNNRIDNEGFGSTDVKEEAEAGSGRFSWKRKLEAVKWYRRTSKLESGVIKKKYPTKSEYLMIIICKETL